MKAIDFKEKICKNCKQLLPTSKFYKQHQTGSRGQIWKYYDTVCIKCRIEYSLIRRREIKRQAIIYKGGKCIDCGYDDLNHVEVFDFHHTIGSKDFSISTSAKSFKTIKNELDKCVLLCSNCHRIRHYTI